MLPCRISNAAWPLLDDQGSEVTNLLAHCEPGADRDYLDFEDDKRLGPSFLADDSSNLLIHSNNPAKIVPRRKDDAQSQSDEPRFGINVECNLSEETDMV